MSRDRAAIHVAAVRRFIEDEGAARQSRTRYRYHCVLAHLLLYLDTVDVEPHLGTGPAGLLAGERRLGSECSSFRILGFDELVALLPGFVEPEWMLPTRGDARSQIYLTERLLNRLRRDRLIDMGVVACAYWEGPGRSRTGETPFVRLRRRGPRRVVRTARAARDPRRPRRVISNAQSDSIEVMAAVTIRNIPDATHRALKARAARHGRSTEAEIRAILADAVAIPDDQKLGQRLRRMAEAAGGFDGVDFDAVRSHDEPRAADFS